MNDFRGDMRPQSPTRAIDWAVAALAERQHGVVASGQLRGLGLRPGAIGRRVRAGRLHPVHRGVYAVGHRRLSNRGRWMAAVLSCGDGAVLSHTSAAALWGLVRARAGAPDVTSLHGHSRRRDVVLHRSRLEREDRAVRDGIPVTSVPRTLFDLAGIGATDRLERTVEEADRLGLLELRSVERLCERCANQPGVRALRRVLDRLTAPDETRSELEWRFAGLCRDTGLPIPAFNALVRGAQVDALWPDSRVIVELDGFAFHRHRGAFERDRARDVMLELAGYRVLRFTHRRVADEPEAVGAAIRRFLQNRQA